MQKYLFVICVICVECVSVCAHVLTSCYFETFDLQRIYCEGLICFCERYPFVKILLQETIAICLNILYENIETVGLSK